MQIVRGYCASDSGGIQQTVDEAHTGTEIPAVPLQCCGIQNSLATDVNLVNSRSFLLIVGAHVYLEFHLWGRSGVNSGQRNRERDVRVSRNGFSSKGVNQSRTDPRVRWNRSLDIEESEVEVVDVRGTKDWAQPVAWSSVIGYSDTDVIEVPASVVPN